MSKERKKSALETYEPSGSREKREVEVHVGKLFIWIPIIILLIAVTFSTIYTVSAGERAVLLTFGKASTESISSGLHVKVPFVQKVVRMDVKTQKYEAQASAASADLQTVSTEITLNYYISPERAPEIFSNIGIGYQDKIIQPAVQEVVKAATAKYTAEELITRREDVKNNIDQLLKDKLSIYGINVQETLITNFDFSESFNNAIEAKVTAEQNALAARNKLEQVKYEAEQRVTQATAEAEAIKIQATAIQAQGGADYVHLQAISKWNGVMPQFMGGNGAVPFINVPSGE